MMRGNSNSHIALLVLSMAVLIPQYILATGWRSAYLPGSALALSLAEGGTALSHQVELASVNPVHVWGETVESINYSHLQMFGDLSSHNLRWHGNYRNQPTQFELRSVAEVGLELRGSTPTSEPLGEFSARYLSASIFRGAQLRHFKLGLGVTYAYQRIYEYAASSLTIAFGASGNIANWLRWGAALQGLGTAQKLHVEKAELPLRISLGLASKLPWEGGLLAVDAIFEPVTNWRPSISYYHSTGFYSIAAGVRIFEDEPMFTGGAELRHGKWSLAYAIGFQTVALGQPQMFSFRRKF
ncbi:hypothetical protein ACFL6E_06475 [Candidatus Neomarinimicrobiota bacterium]